MASARGGAGQRPAPINTGDPTDLTPDVPGDAQVILGTGVSSVVSLVTRQGSRCARKQLRGFRSSPAEIGDFVNEFALMGAFRHPNIVRILSADYEHGCLNIFMEYVDGASLADRYARSGNVPERVLGRIAWFCLEALAYLRSKHILHRDLKPSNILISDAGDVKVCDFGLAAHLAASSDERNTSAGTLKYMSLERLKGKPYTFPADIWSLGMLIYEGAAGRYPVDDAALDMWGLQEKFEKGLDFSLVGYSDEMKAFLRHCLAQAPDDRLAVENRRRSWAGRFENQGQEELMQWVGLTNTRK